MNQNVSNTAQSALGDHTRRQLIMLTVVFLLGMAVNLIGLPSETSSAAKIATMVFLGLHVLIGVGLVTGAVFILLQAMKLGPTYGRLARMGVMAIGLTFVAGMLSMATESNWWSYAMAAGFVASFWVYGMLFVRAYHAK